MTDHFAVLRQPRRPWLDADALKESFHHASAAWHPDVAGSGDAARFAAANAAYRALREPGSRLRHLLELEFPESLTGAQAIPVGLADFFMGLAELQRGFEAYQKKHASATNALSRALLAADRLALKHRADHLNAGLDSAHEAALAELRSLDAEWEARPADALPRLGELHQRFAYLSKWRTQLAEVLFKLES